jgi:hypothetical protein
MPIPAFLKRRLDAALARRGFERIASRLVYPWQRAPVDLPSHSGAPLPAGAEEALRADHPRLQELTRAYRELDSPSPGIRCGRSSSRPPTSGSSGGNYIFRCAVELERAMLSYYCAGGSRVERLGCSIASRTGSSALHFPIDGRRVSRDLLDSALELAFLERHLGLSQGPKRTILDIGAGYGRLAHRAASAFPDNVRWLCTDAIATSTFLSEYYLGFRALGDAARVIPLHELGAAIRPGEVDIAVNIHSFSECAPAAIDAWMAFLAANRIGHLMVVPNAVSADGAEGITMRTNTGQDFSAIVRRHGYVLAASEPKYADPVVQEYGVSPAAYLLFRLDS